MPAYWFSELTRHSSPSNSDGERGDSVPTLCEHGLKVSAVWSPPCLIAWGRQTLAWMEEFASTTTLDMQTGASLEPVVHTEVLRSMAGRRRHWSLEQKLAIVSEAERCGNVTAVCRRYDVRPSLVYTWRREFRYAKEAARFAQPNSEPLFIPAVSGPHISVRDRNDHISIEVEIGSAIVRISRSAEVRLVTAVVEALAGPR